MSTSRTRTPAGWLRDALHRLLEQRAERRARVAAATTLPDLIERLGRRYRGMARRHGVQLALELDPALAIDLVGPFTALGEILQGTLDIALQHPSDGIVTLGIDVVDDAPGQQIVHFSVDAVLDSAIKADAAMAALRDKVGRLGGELLIEPGRPGHLIVELGFIVPPTSPHVDVLTLRATLGSDEALSDVIRALADALAADVGQLEDALARADGPAVRQWLHRVSGALGMAEATGLAAMGLRLEREMAERSVEDMALAVRRFAADATRSLDWLREAYVHDPLI